MYKKLLSFVSLILSLGVTVGCIGCGKGGNGASESNKENNKAEEDVILDITPEVPGGYLQLAVGEASGYKTEGYGCQVDTHIFKESYNNFYGEEEIKEWLARIDDMELQTIRNEGSWLVQIHHSAPNHGVRSSNLRRGTSR